MKHEDSTAFRYSSPKFLTEDLVMEGAVKGLSRTRTGSLERMGSGMEAIGFGIIRYGLGLVIVWIGLMKFTSYEANGIRPLVASSLLLGWTYHFLSVRQFSDVLGVVELSIAILI